MDVHSAFLSFSTIGNGPHTTPRFAMAFYQVARTGERIAEGSERHPDASEGGQAVGTCNGQVGLE